MSEEEEKKKKKKSSGDKDDKKKLKKKKSGSSKSPKGTTRKKSNRLKIKSPVQDVNFDNQSELEQSVSTLSVSTAHMSLDDTVDTEENSKITIIVRQPNGDVLELQDINPRKDTVTTIEDFLSDKYYGGRDKDGTIHPDQLRPIRHKENILDGRKNKRPLREYGIRKDGEVLELIPMTIDVVEFGCLKTLDNIDPINDDIHNLLLQAAGKDIPVEMLFMLHKENMRQVDEEDGLRTFYDNGINEYDTLVIQRKPVVVKIQFPAESEIMAPANDGDVVNVAVGGDEDVPILEVTVNPDKADLDLIRKYISNSSGVPMDCQILTRISDPNDPSRRTRLRGAGDVKFSDPSLGIVDDCILELAPMTINIETPQGITVRQQFFPSTTVEDIKQKLAKFKLFVPIESHRLVLGDGTEVGGEDDNENRIGSDDSLLMELDVDVGDTLIVERTKVPINVKIPYGMKDIEVLVNLQKDTIDQVRRLVFEKTGLSKEYQERYSFGDRLLDDSVLGKFDITEDDSITLDPFRVHIIRMPRKKRVVIDGLNPMKDTVQQLKMKIATSINLAPFKQRLFNPDTDEEYVGDKASTKTLQDHGIKDDGVINLEQSKVNLKIVMPNSDELNLTVDPRIDDLQKVRDFVFNKYYNKRNIPDEDVMRMLIRSRPLNKEPGETKLRQYGIVADDESIIIKPISLSVTTPRRVILCRKIDPFRDTLDSISKIVKKEGINVDGMQIEFDSKEMTDFESVLYDLEIGEGAKLEFKTTT